MNNLLRLPAVMERTGLARPTVYLRAKQGLFPRPVKLGSRMAAWPENEVAAINAARIAGKSDDEIRQLVARLERERAERAA
ncbi:helix-turn-helix transcriptional regulator [Sphingobium yanoikuyae]|uniref:helix-turn-helix transcriptional regulator n=1 Tax=Sphingobium TaxID=165695 RepID=UPI0028AAB093|nr:AlpA family phage regulatory protein [Sphingobium yanoikuyae]